MINKQTFIYELINFSSAENPLTARSIFDKYKKAGETVEQYQREIAKFAREIWQTQFELKSLVTRKGIILSSNGGYYVAEDREQALKGLEYYSKKIETMQKTKWKVQKIINDTFPEPEVMELFNQRS